MKKVALAFFTKDSVELSRQTIEPLIGCGAHIWWFDGSSTEEGKGLPLVEGYPVHHVFQGIRGGIDNAIVRALTELLRAPENYTHIGLVENDVLLDPGFLGPTLALFDRGFADGLAVGAVSARCYKDRILCQRDGYALCHNLGAGQVIFSRRAAEIVLRTFKTGYTLSNRRVFSCLSGLDIGRWWAFGSREHYLTADWNFDTALACDGFASLALTPSPCWMIGQDPPLAEQGLELADAPVELLRDDKAFDTFMKNTLAIRVGNWSIAPRIGNCRLQDDGTFLYFPHHLPALRAFYSGDWGLKWSQGFGPFSWVSTSDGMLQFMANAFAPEAYGPNAKVVHTRPMLTLMLSGPCSFMLSGGRVEVHDAASGYRVTPTLGEGVVQVMVPSGISYREVTVTALDPGVTLYGMLTREAQPWRPHVKFDSDTLPPAGD